MSFVPPMQFGAPGPQYGPPMQASAIAYGQPPQAQAMAYAAPQQQFGQQPYASVTRASSPVQQFHQQYAVPPPQQQYAAPVQTYAPQPVHHHQPVQTFAAPAPVQMHHQPVQTYAAPPVTTYAHHEPVVYEQPQYYEEPVVYAAPLPVERPWPQVPEERVVSERPIGREELFSTGNLIEAPAVKAQPREEIQHFEIQRPQVVQYHQPQPVQTYQAPVQPIQHVQTYAAPVQTYAQPVQTMQQQVVHHQAPMQQMAYAQPVSTLLSPHHQFGQAPLQHAVGYGAQY